MRGTLIPLVSDDSPVSSVRCHAAPRASISCAMVTTGSVYHAPEGRRCSVLLVLRADRLEDRLPGHPREETLAEIAVLQKARDAREGLQMNSRRVFRRDEEEEEPRRAAVERIEIDALDAPAERRDDVRHPGQLPVRNRDS